jgi:hypothetical protein
MFVGGVRSSKLSALLAGTIIFIIVFAGLAWNQMDAIELPNRCVCVVQIASYSLLAYPRLTVSRLQNAAKPEPRLQRTL